MRKTKTDFEGLVGRIRATSDALQQDALVIINRSVTARAWLTGYYVSEKANRRLANWPLMSECQLQR